VFDLLEKNNSNYHEQLLKTIEKLE